MSVFRGLSRVIIKPLAFWRRRQKHSATVNNYQEKIDQRLVYSLSPKKIPSLNQVKHVGKYLSSKENFWIKVLGVIILLNLIFVCVKFYRTNLQISPTRGGEYNEGLVGAPKYINPLYNLNRDVDMDLSSLIFSSLFKRDKDNKLQPDVVESWTMAEDAKAYTLVLKDNVKFHNDEKLTVDDVIFTFEAMKNTDYESPWRNVFLGAEIERIDDRTIKFVLLEPYAAFLDLLTFGILPQNLWSPVAPNTANLADLNLKPIGSGPYQFASLVKNKTGGIKEYVLEANNDYYGEVPYLTKLNFKFYPNISEAIAALNNNAVDGLGYLPAENEKDVLAKNSMSFNRLNWPQLTAVFLNKKSNLFLTDKNIRTALALSLNKGQIVGDVLGERAAIVEGPILPTNEFYNQNLKQYNFNLEEANKILDDAGWKKMTISEDDVKTIEASTPEQAEADADLALKRELAQVASSSQITLAGNWRVKLASKKGNANQYLLISLTTADSGDNLRLGEAIKTAWENLGVRVPFKTVNANQVSSEIIRSRNFEALVFGEMLGADPDVYMFWHSSQTGEGGLNIADYKNKDVDLLLEAGRLTSDRNQRLEKYNKFQEILTDELPVIFLCSPKYTYLQAKKIKGFDTLNINEPHNRFANISHWYIKTKKKLVW